MTPRLSPVVLATLLGISLATGAQAQATLGSLAPSIELKQTFNGCAKSLEDMRGSVVLLDYFATW